jgi:hypothetical protein
MANNDITERDSMIRRALAMAIVVEDKLISEHDQADTDCDAMEDLLMKMTAQADLYVAAALNHLSASVRTR